MTGRPAGWCDHIARFWPVDAMVGENGAFTFFMEERSAKADRYARRNLGLRCQEKTSRPFGPDSSRRFLMRNGRRIRRIANTISRSTSARTCPRGPRVTSRRFLKLCHQAGAHAKLSSIHVNAWFGEYDKKSGLKHWFEQGAPGLVRSAPKWEELLLHRRFAQRRASFSGIQIFRRGRQSQEVPRSV